MVSFFVRRYLILFLHLLLLFFVEHLHIVDKGNVDGRQEGLPVPGGLPWEVANPRSFQALRCGRSLGESCWLKA